MVSHGSSTVRLSHVSGYVYIKEDSLLSNGCLDPPAPLHLFLAESSFRVKLMQVQDGTVFSSNLIKHAEESLIQKKTFDSGKSSGFHLAGFHDVV